jgi:HSP20 family molecular chaperone IbpA
MGQNRGSNWFDGWMGINDGTWDTAFEELAAQIEKKVGPTYRISTDDISTTIHIAVPGYSKTSLDVNVENNTLTVVGTQGNANELTSLKYFTKPFKLQWALASGKYDIGGIRTAMLNGILEVTLPLQKRTESSTKRVIPIH